MYGGHGWERSSGTKIVGILHTPETMTNSTFALEVYNTYRMPYLSAIIAKHSPVINRASTFNRC